MPLKVPSSPIEAEDTTVSPAGARPMQILHTVQSYPPAEGGMAEVVRQLSERLARMGHAVTVATQSNAQRLELVTNGVTVLSFPVSGNSVNGIHGDVTGYQRFLLESRFDIVTNFAAQQWATDLALPLLPQIAGRKVFVPTGFSGLFSRRYRGYFRKMAQWMRHYDMNVFLSESYRDVAFAREHGIEKMVLIPNGAAADEFLAEPCDLRVRLAIPADHFLVLHVGSHTCFKGHSEALEIFERAALRKATFLLVGNEFEGGCASSCRATSGTLNASQRFRAQEKRIIVAPLSRRETVAAYHAADLFLFPSNVECSPIVLFECMASHTPFLATDAGNSAEIIRWSCAGELLSSAPREFLPRHGTLPRRLLDKVRLATGLMEDLAAVRADVTNSALLLESCYRDRARLDRMAGSGFRVWKERFTWEKIACQYEALYRELLKGPAR